MLNIALIGQAIAADIERLGHYQKGAEFRDSACCIVTSPTFDKNVMQARESRAVCDRIAQAAGLEVEDEFYAFDAVVAWNDTTPTEQVLDTLRSL